jgi:hypothetical protein
MVAISIAFALLFVALVAGTITAVLNDDTPTPAELADLPLPSGVEIVDSIATCNESACDGEGAVLIGESGEGVAGLIARFWHDEGWGSLPCTDGGTMCFAEEDLRISLSVWSDVDPLDVPTLWESVTDRGLEPRSLVYVHYYRCGPIYPCG